MVLTESGYMEIYVNNEAQTPVFFDNLSVTRSSGNAVEVNAYYPYGMIIPLLSDHEIEGFNAYKYGAKELQEEMNLNWGDHGARMADYTIGRWWVPDPLAENYYSWGPYNYALNNPIGYIDPDGREVLISGALSDEALRQLQKKMNNRITLTRDSESGKVSYTVNEGQKLKGDAKRLAEIIDNNSISVNVITTSKNETSTGNLMVGGAFMGNTVTSDANGNTTVVANQEVNPNVLGSADTYTKTPGKMMMHEVTEAYEGAKISQTASVSSPASNVEGSVFPKAHNRATLQTSVYETVYDIKGNVLRAQPDGRYPATATRSEWYVKKRFRKK